MNKKKENEVLAKFNVKLLMKIAIIHLILNNNSSNCHHIRIKIYYLKQFNQNRQLMIKMQNLKKKIYNNRNNKTIIIQKMKNYKMRNYNN